MRQKTTKKMRQLPFLAADWSVWVEESAQLESAFRVNAAAAITRFVFISPFGYVDVARFFSERFARLVQLEACEDIGCAAANVGVLFAQLLEISSPL
jgi:hypothetical protein